MSLVSEYGVDVANIAIIAELTTEEGPMLDDHFLVMVLKDGSVVEIPFEKARTGIVFQELKVKLDLNITSILANRTTFESYIIYPEELKGLNLFFFKEVRESLWKKIKRFGLVEVSKEFTPEVQAYLQDNGE